VFLPDGHRIEFHTKGGRACPGPDPGAAAGLMTAYPHARRGAGAFGGGGRKPDIRYKRGIVSLAGATKVPGLLFGWKADAEKNPAGSARP